MTLAQGLVLHASASACCCAVLSHFQHHETRRFGRIAWLHDLTKWLRAGARPQSAPRQNAGRARQQRSLCPRQRSSRSAELARVARGVHSRLSASARRTLMPLCRLWILWPHRWASQWHRRCSCRASQGAAEGQEGRQAALKRCRVDGACERQFWSVAVLYHLPAGAHCRRARYLEPCITHVFARFQHW